MLDFKLDDGRCGVLPFDYFFNFGCALLHLASSLEKNGRVGEFLLGFLDDIGFTFLISSMFF